MAKLLSLRYGLLDVAREASPEGLRVAYRKAIRRAHPDKGGSSEAFLAVSRAFDAGRRHFEGVLRRFETF